MIIVAMSCHNGIYVQYIFRQDGELHRQRHIIAFQQRINNENGTRLFTMNPAIPSQRTVGLLIA